MGSTSNLLGEFIMGLFRPDKLLVILFQIPAVFWLLIGCTVSVHLQTNCLSDWPQIWWMYSLCDSPGLVEFWYSVFWLVKKLSCILLIRWTSNLADELIMGLPVKFWSCFTELLLFPGLWLMQQFLHICRQIADQIDIRFGMLFVQQFLHFCRQTANQTDIKFGQCFHYGPC